MAKTETPTRKEQELKNIKTWRLKQFVNVLGPEWPIDDILSLVESEVDYHDLENLLEKGWPKHLAIKTLL